MFEDHYRSMLPSTTTQSVRCARNSLLAVQPARRPGVLRRTWVLLASQLITDASSHRMEPSLFERGGSTHRGESARPRVPAAASRTGPRTHRLSRRHDVRAFGTGRSPRTDACSDTPVADPRWQPERFGIMLTTRVPFWHHRYMGRNPSRTVDASLHAAVINACLATQTSVNTPRRVPH